MPQPFPSRLAASTAFALASSVALAGAQQAQQPQQQQQQQEQQRQSTQQSDATQQPITPVRLAQLEDDPQQYIGRRVSVSGEVEDVLGPRIFKIDERNWLDLDRELLVVLDTPLAALLKEDDLVTGTVRQFVDVDFEREWGWIDLDPEIEARIRTRPVLVATSVVGSNPDVGMLVSIQEPATSTAGQQQPGAVGTTGRASSGDTRPAVTDVAELARATDNTHVGRRVNLSSVKVDRTAAKAGGFWVTANGEELFVLPSDPRAGVKAGQTVNIEGHVLRLPEQMEDRIEKSKKVGNEEVFVYATTIK